MYLKVASCLELAGKCFVSVQFEWAGFMKILQK